MKENYNTDEFESMVNTINNLSEEDAKALLKIIYGFINTAMTGNGGDEMKLEIMNKLPNVFDQIPTIYESSRSSD
ncbi:hypothetical protein [Ornithinibacillus halophilus]|uniref:Uncharacterized protein n=1 Tax=Ornithinibacillus halophilus TaxID=930117 RepID=A0A1M5MP55_9BACI|nr:hypothetical protein [Ornithinibacillus halophilus]SHG79026.1 hypothetical protein SAMN05216225_106216 [Ornithinibacillus halophilus]